MVFVSRLLQNESVTFNDVLLTDFSEPANTTKTSQLAEDYYGAHSALLIPLTLIFRWGDNSTRPVIHHRLPNIGLLLRLSKQKDSITKLCPTRDSNPRTSGSAAVQASHKATEVVKHLISKLSNPYIEDRIKLLKKE
ncbi:unnamed protein product, partial [Brenthis ino]